MNRAFKLHRAGAKRRGISFLFEFSEWVTWWESHLGPNWLELRGNKRGKYNMGRLGDVGPYSISNVYLTKHEDNCRLGSIGKIRSPQTIEKLKKVNLGRKESLEHRRKKSEAMKRFFNKKRSINAHQT